MDGNLNLFLSAIKDKEENLEYLLPPVHSVLLNGGWPQACFFPCSGEKGDWEGLHLDDTPGHKARGKAFSCVVRYLFLSTISSLK